MVFCVLLRKGWGCDALLPLVQVWPSKLDTRDVVSSACGLAELWQLATLFLSQWACPCRDLLLPMYLDLFTLYLRAHSGVAGRGGREATAGHHLLVYLTSPGRS